MLCVCVCVVSCVVCVLVDVCCACVCECYVCVWVYVCCACVCECLCVCWLLRTSPPPFLPSPPSCHLAPLLSRPLFFAQQTRMATEGDSQRDSNEAPSSAPPPAALRLSLSAEEKASLLAEIDRLQATSVICKVAGFRPSRGEMRDLLQARLLADVGKIVDVQTLGRSFYQIEFEAPDMAARVLQLSPLTLRAGRAYFRPWRHGFDPTTEVVEEASFPVSVCLPGLRREYLHLLPQIGGIFGVTLETPRTAASVAAKAAGLPSVRVLISDPSALPKEIFLPAASGAWFRQRVEYTGLPNQCFVCRKIGHLAKACPRRQTRSASRTGTGTGTGTQVQVQVQVRLRRNSALPLLLRQVRQVFPPLDRPLPVGGIPPLSDSSLRRGGRPFILDDVGREEAALLPPLLSIGFPPGIAFQSFVRRSRRAPPILALLRARPPPQGLLSPPLRLPPLPPHLFLMLPLQGQPQPPSLPLHPYPPPPPPPPRSLFTPFPLLLLPLELPLPLAGLDGLFSMTSA